jgi:hypothetical protein
VTAAIVAYVPDLMDRSKVAAAAPAVTFVTSPGELATAQADVVVLDLSRPGVLDVLPLPRPARVVGFASHVDTATLDAARNHGVLVLPRSRFFRDVGALLTET